MIGRLGIFTFIAILLFSEEFWYLKLNFEAKVWIKINKSLNNQMAQLEIH